MQSYKYLIWSLHHILAMLISGAVPPSLGALGAPCFSVGSPLWGVSAFSTWPLLTIQGKHLRPVEQEPRCKDARPWQGEASPEYLRFDDNGHYQSMRLLLWHMGSPRAR